MGPQSNRRLWIAGRWLGGGAVALVVLLATYLIANGRQNMFNFGSGKLSVGRVDARVPSSSLKYFFDRLKAFSANNQLLYRDSVVTPQGNEFSILMWRKDVAISVTNWSPPNESHFDAGFYIDSDNGGNLDTVRRLTEALADDLSDIPGITVLDRAPR
jgi:hypothetical protein